ncbi:unnamed protein product, partial [marine sediment metagenome]
AIVRAADAMTSAKAAFTGAARQITLALAPAVEKLGNLLAQMGKGGVLTKLADGVTWLVTTLMDLHRWALKAWVAVLKLWTGLNAMGFPTPWGKGAAGALVNAQKDLAQLIHDQKVMNASMRGHAAAARMAPGGMAKQVSPMRDVFGHMTAKENKAQTTRAKQLTALEKIRDNLHGLSRRPTGTTVP